MNDVTQVLSAVEHGDPSAAERLLPLVYDQLRKLAAQKLRNEKPGQTIQGTDLVHEAYVRLVDVDHTQHWNSRGHFFAAAAEAIRRILVENARRKLAIKRGGKVCREELSELEIASPEDAERMLAVHEALDRLAMTDEAAAQLVKLRYFAGFTVADAAKLMGISPRSAQYLWAYARSWLRRDIPRD
ncbi:MAG: sigma-70 family RNA polymerase sigma factor [Planctomycetes bacterium]|nr:sigma-70 family RNA polymerase sigma factor [Planctomycetota bacterium]